MRISLNEIKKLVPAAATISTDELVKLIGSRLVEVEEQIRLAPKYAGIYIARVVSCEAIPETHLHLCQIDAGVAGGDFAAEDGLVQVVCGAPNVHTGMNAVWIAPGSIVPQTYGGENFKLDVRKLRGYESNGMLAGLDELDLGDDHSGIVEINPEIEPGTLFAEAFDLNDVILDIENKSLTHRPDCFGLIGFAREVAGILGVEFNGAEAVAPPSSTGPAPVIEIMDTELCPRYSCAVLEMDDALTDDKYLTEMDVFLAKAGMRGISKIVDVTNYVMLMTGQPLHAFDYDKFVKVGGAKEPKIIVRAAKDGEELGLLDGKSIECNANDIVITSNDVPVALAGAMGGANTEIDANTRKVILESATFSLYHLRKTQMAHGIFSEAITRFTKGQPAAATMEVLGSACELLGAKVLAAADNYPEPIKPEAITVRADEINALLGTKYDSDRIARTLRNVGFEVDNDGEKLKVIAPIWRTDIHIREDITEEVGRLLGYDNIPLDLPERPFVALEQNPLVNLKGRLRNILSERMAAHEVLTYSFVSQKLQESVGEDVEDAYKIVNSLSPELQCFRQSLVPSLLEKMRDNLKAGYKDFALYEMNQVTRKSLGCDEDGVPVLKNHLALVTTGDYYKAKAPIVAMLAELGFAAPEFVALGKQAGEPVYLEQLHAAAVLPSADLPEPIAYLGEMKPAVLRQLKIGTPVAVFEVELDTLLPLLPATKTVRATISKFPAVERDLTMHVSSDTIFAEAKAAILRIFKARELKIELTPVSIYQAEAMPEFKNISFHLRFSSPEKTLTSSEISDIMEAVSKNIKTAVGAEVV